MQVIDKKMMESCYVEQQQPVEVPSDTSWIWAKMQDNDNWFKTSIENLRANMEIKLPQSWIDIGEQTKEIADGVYGKIIDGTREGADWLLNTDKGFAIGNFDFKERFQNLAERFEVNYDSLMNKMQEGWAQTQSKNSDFWQNILDQGRDVLEKIPEINLDYIVDGIQQAGSSVGDFFQDQGNYIRESDSGFLGTIQNGAQPVYDGLREAGEWAQDRMQPVDSAIRNGAQAVGDFFQDQGNYIRESDNGFLGTMQNGMQPIYDGLREVGDWVGDRAQDAGEWLVDRAQDTWEAIEEFFERD